MKIGLYSPYLDSLGGGEKYFFSLAEDLTSLGKVEVFWPEKAILTQARERLGLSLKKIAINPDGWGELRKGWWRRLRFTRTYDRFFWVSDGSVPLIGAQKNYLHFQVPFRGEGISVRNKIKLSRFSQVIVNSNFTKETIDRSFKVKSLVVYPPVQANSFHFGRKKKVIAAVGRFSQHFMAKKQEVLIEVFKKLCQGGLREWKLRLVGGVLLGDKGYLESLRKSALGYPIEFLTNLPFSQLVEILAEASIFWHAAGYGENTREHPERMEHFGIAPLEAQASGCIPLVFAGGGLVEIVEDGKNGFLWKTKEELGTKTRKLTQEDVNLEFRARMRQTAKQYNQEVFSQKMVEIFRD